MTPPESSVSDATIRGIYYKHITIVNDDSGVLRMTLQAVASRTIVILMTLEAPTIVILMTLETGKSY